MLYDIKIAFFYSLNDMMKVVLDTNILVSASRSSAGASFAVLVAVREKRLLPLVSVPLVLEYEAVLCRPEHLAAAGRSIADTVQFLDAFMLMAQAVDLHYLWRPQTRDVGDEMVLETALNGSAQALVTHNVRDFVAAARFALPVLTPQQLLRMQRHTTH